MSKTSSFRSQSHFLSTENVKLHLSAGSGYATVRKMEMSGVISNEGQKRAKK